MKKQLKYALYLCGFTLCVMGFLNTYSFSSTISQTIPATVYRDGIAVEETTVAMEGKRTNYVFHDNEWYAGTFAIDCMEWTTHDTHLVEIRWDNDHHLQKFSYWDYETEHHEDICFFMVISDDMTQLGLQRTDGAFIVTSPEVLALMEKHFTLNNYGGSSVRDVQSIPPLESLEPIPVDTLWQDILLGKATVYDPLSQEPVDIYSLGKVLLTDDFTVEQFAKVALDGDGIQEMLLRIDQDQGTHTSILILHRQGDSATIYAAPERWMYDIKTDGSYQYSLGGLDYGITTKLSFQGASYVARQGIYSLGMDGTSAIYAVGDDTPLTEQDLQQAYAQQDEKDAVRWYDFTIENIQSYGLGEHD